MRIIEEPVIKVDCKQGLIRAVRFNADGQYAMTCGSDRTIKLWRPSKLLQLKCYKGHSSDVIDCQANQDSSQFVSCSNDRSIIVWDVENGKILRRFRNLAPFTSICYGHEASTILAGSIDGTARIYDLRAVNAWEPIQTLTEASDNVTCCKIYKHLLFTTSLDKSLRTYDIRKGAINEDTFHMPLNYVSLSRNADSLLVNCLRGNTILVDRAGAKILNLYKGSEDGKVYIWDVQDAQPKIALEHVKIVPPVIQSISSDLRHHLLTGCSNFLFMWSLE